LKRLLERGVFLTQSFQNRYEVQARENIQSELAHWTYRWLPAL
jgi:predicted metal-dependent HD superfamily phosphohydrolase